jgi:hypothetical protein
MRLVGLLVACVGFIAVAESSAFTVVVKASQKHSLGLTLQFNASTGEAVVLNVDTEGPAVTELKSGDVVQQIDGQDVKGASIIQVRKFLQPAAESNVLFTIVRGGANNSANDTCSESAAVDLAVLDVLLSKRGAETELCAADSYWGVGQVVVINLDRRADRWEQFQERSASLGHRSTCVWRFSGFDGRNSQMSAGLKRIFEGNDFYYHPGVMGATLSHLAGRSAVTH